MSTQIVIHTDVLPVAARTVDEFFKWMDANSDRIAESNAATDLTLTTAALMKFYFERIDAVRERAAQLEEAARASERELVWVLARVPEMKRLHQLAAELLDARTQRPD